VSDDPFLALPGAVAADTTGAAAAHFGAPLIEQRALAAGEAIVSLASHGIVTVRGEDRLSWLHSMTSQGLLGLRPGDATETLLLDPQGRIERAIRVIDDGECTWLLVDPDSAAPLTEFLQRMRFALRVEVADASGEFAAVLAFEGGAAVPALRGLGLALVEWHDPWRAVSRGGVQYFPGAQDAHAGHEWNAVQFVFRREDLPAVTALVSSGAVQAAGILALDALEIRAWRPTQRGEVDTRSVPHELDWLRTAVHLNKGCYRGQETVAKVHNLGHPPRRLVMLHLDGSEGQLPEAGALVYLAGGSAEGARPVGRVTRAALHHEWGGIALALLKRSVAEDAALEVALESSAAIAAAQEVIVPSDAGATRDIPRLRRI